MGRRLIIPKADFSANGIKENFIDLSISTRQGMVLPQANHPDVGKLSADARYTNNYIHGANKAIILKPGDTIYLAPPNSDMRASIFAYTSVIDGVYPDLINSESENIKVGTLVNGILRQSGEEDAWPSIRNSYSPRYMTNNSNVDWYMIVQINDQNKNINVEDFPTINYRIYATDLSPYVEETVGE